MKHVRWIVAACSLLAACALEDPELGTVEQHLNGDIWVNADTAQLAPAFPTDVAFANGQHHDVYVVGQVSSDDAWSFRRSSDGGATWTNGPTFSLAPGKQAIAESIAVDHDGRILVSGRAEDSFNREHFITRLSTNRGHSFTTVDDLLLAPGDYWGVRSLTFQSNGQAVVAATRNGTWFHRRSKPGGTGWTPIAAPVGVTIINFCASGADLIAVGSAVVPGAGTRGVTYRLAGDPWTLLDSVRASPDGYLIHSSCTQNGSALFVGGRDDRTWRTRRSLDGGVSWTTVDSVPCVFGPILDMGAGRGGSTYSIGRCKIDGPGYDDWTYWRVRRTDDGGSTWVDSDFFTEGEFNSAGGASYAYDPDTEDTITVGWGTASGVRRLKH